MAGRARLPLDRADALIGMVGLALIGVFLAAEQWVAGASGLPLDDSWIHLRMADNLVRGRGFGVNPGEPVAASTAPLWTLLVAAALALGLPGLVAVKTLGVGAYLATALLTRRLALALGLGSALAMAAGLGAAGLGRLLWGALSGMEVPLATALVAAAALAETRGRSSAAALTLGLATLARPEAGLLIPLHALSAPGLRAAGVRLLLAGAVLAPAVAFNLATTGRPVPGTVAAKVLGGLIGHQGGLPDAWRATATALGHYTRRWGVLLWRDHPALPLLGLIGLAALRRSPLRWLLLALVVHPMATAIIAPVREPGFQTGRYSSHLLPLAVVAALAGLAVLLDRTPGRRRGTVAAVLLAVGLVLGLDPAVRDYAWGVQNINGQQVRLARWVAAHTPPESVLAVNDIGALSYLGDRRILDLMGLATPEILPYRRAGPDGITRYLRRTCPDYLVIFPTWFPFLAERTDLLRPVTAVELRHNRVSGGPVMVVYETVWNRWRPAPEPCTGRDGTGFLDSKHARLLGFLSPRAGSPARVPVSWTTRRR